MPDAPPLPEAYCLTCGYRLDTFADPRCPECGRAFDAEDPYSVRAPQFWRPRLWRHWIILGGLLITVSVMTMWFVIAATVLVHAMRAEGS